MAMLRPGQVGMPRAREPFANKNKGGKEFVEFALDDANAIKCCVAAVLSCSYLPTV
jgi:hypothetical protein